MRQLLGKAFVTLKGFGPKDLEYAFWRWPRFVSQCAIHNGRIYAGTVSDGIYAFPLAGGDGVRIGETEGLPAPAVVSLAALEGKLVAALEGGYLVVFDLATRRCEVIASSRRTQPLSPLDNGQPFRADGLVADPERHRVLFMASEEGEGHPNTGTWEYDLAARRFRKVLPLAYYQISPVRGGRFYLRGLDWANGHWVDWVGRFDLGTDRFTLLSGKLPRGADPQTPAGLPRDLSAAFPGLLYHAGYVWNALPFSRRPIGGGPEEFLPHVTGRTALNVSVDQCLEAVGPDQLLVGDGGGLYLVRLKGAGPAATPPRPVRPRATR